MLSSPVNPSCAGDLPLPSSCGNSIASNPMTVKLMSDSTGSCQLRCALARDVVASALNQNAPIPKSGPMAVDHVIRVALERELRHRVQRAGAEPRPGDDDCYRRRRERRKRDVRLECAEQHFEDEYRAAERHIVDGSKPRTRSAGDHHATFADRQPRAVRQPAGKHHADLARCDLPAEG